LVGQIPAPAFLMIFSGTGKLCVTDTPDFFTFLSYKYFSDDLTMSSGVSQPRKKPLLCIPKAHGNRLCHIPQPVSLANLIVVAIILDYHQLIIIIHRKYKDIAFVANSLPIEW
jgi:hypothetical protein